MREFKYKLSEILRAFALQQDEPFGTKFSELHEEMIIAGADKNDLFAMAKFLEESREALHSQIDDYLRTAERLNAEYGEYKQEKTKEIELLQSQLTDARAIIQMRSEERKEANQKLRWVFELLAKLLYEQEAKQ